MIKIKKNIKKFKDLITIASKYNTNVNLEFNKEELKIFMIDYALVSMIELVFKKDFFEEYNIEEEMSCNVDSDILIKIIKKVAKKEFELLPSLESLIVKTINDNFEITLYDKPFNDKTTPEYNASSEFIVPTTEFFDAINDYISFDAICEFSVKNDKITLSTKNQKVKGNSIITSNKITNSDDKNSYYDGNYIAMISDIKNIFDEVEIHFGSNFPCKIKQSNDELKFTWVLAERIAEEE